MRMGGFSYGMEVDWWTVGTLLYEMLTGLPPFYDEDTQVPRAKAGPSGAAPLQRLLTGSRACAQEMYRRILFQPLSFPEEVSLKVGRVGTAELRLVHMAV
jgi:serum/glucocorticoid-regulated kinase 2